MPDPKNKAYAKIAGPELDQRAAREFKAEPIPDESHAVALRMTGPCPACTHDTLFLYPLVAWVEGVAPSEMQAEADEAIKNGHGVSSWAGDVRMHCLCEQSHKGQKEEKGCGARYGMSVRWGTP